MTQHLQTYTPAPYSGMLGFKNTERLSMNLITGDSQPPHRQASYLIAKESSQPCLQALQSVCARLHSYLHSRSGTRFSLSPMQFTPPYTQGVEPRNARWRPGAGGGAASCDVIGSISHTDNAAVICTVLLMQPACIRFLGRCSRNQSEPAPDIISQLGCSLSQANLMRSRHVRVCACGCLHVQNLRLLFFMSSCSRFCRACCRCSLQTKHVMCFAPAK